MIKLPSAKIDVAVLILFFNRPEPLAELFKQVKAARPAKLFLYQDGPRGAGDMAGIEACRKVVSDIDWDCEVHTMYQEKNYGCDPSNYMSQKWAFSHVDKCIILEDDDVPSQSFFMFCKEMLDRYEYDTRIAMISGMNHEEISKDTPYDYFFTSNMSIWGWATWRRVVEKWDETYSFLSDDHELARLKGILRQKGIRKDFLRMCRAHKAQGKAFYESILYSYMLLNSALAIVPAKNLINNIGDMAGSVHFESSYDTMPRGYRRIFTMKRHELLFPLKHPVSVVENVDYLRRVYRILGINHPFVKIYRSLEELYINIKKGNFSIIRKRISERITKLLGRKRYH